MERQETGLSLRERTRHAVQAELVDVAQGLFVQYGYESVTVEHIAAAAGMSKRSFFRYFAGKDELILGKYERQGEDLARALAARPAEEQPWTALRHMFDGVVEYIADPAKAARTAELDRVIASSPTLRAGFLERMERMQRDIVATLLEREKGALPELEGSALVAAAFAAMTTARQHVTDDGPTLAVALDRAMAAIAGVQAA